MKSSFELSQELQLVHLLLEMDVGIGGVLCLLGVVVPVLLLDGLIYLNTVLLKLSQQELLRDQRSVRCENELLVVLIPRHEPVDFHLRRLIESALEEIDH